MAEHTHRVVDKITGTETTGHEWDGIRELNTSLPRWWLWTFYMTIIWSIGYWIVYPTWPLVSSYTSGMFGWQSRQAILDDLAALKAQRAAMVDRIAATPLQEILGDQTLLDFARAQGRTAFADNCAPCHGAGGGGAKGYPDLNDDDWLWGGKLDDIAFTIHHGVRSTDENTRVGSMPAFGRDKILSRSDILRGCGLYALAFWSCCARQRKPRPGQEGFRRQLCRVMAKIGKGNREIGAPDPTDQIWLLWIGQQHHRRRSDEWARRGYAGLGPASRRYDR